MSFTVDKWYLDLVTDDGTAVVGYQLRVRWLGIDLPLAARLVVSADGQRDERSSCGDPSWPRFEQPRLWWDAASLDLHGEWCAIDGAVARTLLSSPAGRLDWSCLAPRARASVTVESRRYEGLGYAEHLQLTLPPWTLPFTTLRWGRHLSDQHTLIWIERDGAEHLHDIWLDGRPEPAAHVESHGVAGLSGGRALRWSDSRDLVRRSVGHAIAAVAPALARQVGGRLAAMHEHKQLSPSSLVDEDGRRLDAGWTIHEEVTW